MKPSQLDKTFNVGGSDGLGGEVAQVDSNDEHFGVLVLRAEKQYIAWRLLQHLLRRSTMKEYPFAAMSSM